MGKFRENVVFFPELWEKYKNFPKFSHDFSQCGQNKPDIRACSVNVRKCSPFKKLLPLALMHKIVHFSSKCEKITKSTLPEQKCNLLIYDPVNPFEHFLDAFLILITMH